MAAPETTKTTTTLPARQFSQNTIGRISPPTTGRVQIADTSQRGLWLRISSSGVRTWSVMYRIRDRGGRVQRLTIGRFPDMGVKEARLKAAEARTAAGKGEDPTKVLPWVRAKKAAAPDTAAEPAPDMFGAVAAEWIKRQAAPRQARSLDQTEAALKRYLLPEWGERPIRSITKHDVLTLIDAIQDHGHGRTANKTLGLAQRVFRWAAQRDLIDRDPAAAVAKPAPERSRSHVLEDAELAAVWKGAGRMGIPGEQFIRLLSLLGQRRVETATVRWEHIDFERAIWHLPAESAKGGRAHDVPLSPPALAILRAMPQIVGNPFVFSSSRGETSPIKNFSRLKDRIDRLSGVTGWRLHDLRRTTATGLAKLGVEPHVIGRILNHSPGSTMGITAIYNRHRYDEAARIALERWGEYVLNLAAGRANVVPLAGRGA